MEIFKLMEKYEQEILAFCYEPATKFQGLISINDTTLGPAIGGARMHKYTDEDELILDALKLAQNMTYQAAITGQDAGGGKAIILGNPEIDKTEPYLRAFGRFIEGFNGLFVTASEMGTDDKDMQVVFRETNHVIWEKTKESSVTSEEVAAHGVLAGIKACVAEKFNTTDIKNFSVAVQGVGNVGRNLIKLLMQEGIKQLFITDIRYDSIKTIQDHYDNVIIVNPDEIMSCGADIFSPCAIGRIINDQTIRKINAKIIAGGALNVLENYETHGQALHDRGILYAPDFIIGSSTIIRGVLYYTHGIMDEQFRPTIQDAADRIFRILTRVFQHSSKKNIPTTTAAIDLLKERINLMKSVKNIYNQNNR